MKNLADLIASLLLGAIVASAVPTISSCVPAARHSLTEHPGQALSGVSPQQRVRLAPRFLPGQALRYQFEFRTRAEGRSTGLLENPQAPSQIELSALTVVRLEVLNVEPARLPPGQNQDYGGQARPGDPQQPVRLRATYEKAVATSRSDSYAPEAAAIEEQYRKLQGHSIEFVVGPDGSLSEVEGLRELLPDEKLGSASRDWLAQIAITAGSPPEGIVVGQKWSSEHPLPSAPLAGMTWRTESTYLRDEPCWPGRPEARGAAGSGSGSAAEMAQPNPSAAGESCAVILAQLELAPGRALHDTTPEEYRKRGLRTAGFWKGSGESLSYVSLRTGLVVSVTQTSVEEIDVTVSSADGHTRVRYTSRIQSESHLALLPDSYRQQP